MPIFKGSASKANPNKGIAYITNAKKAVIVSELGLFPSKIRPYAEQFRQTADYFCKALDENSRKYYHFKLSFSPNDEITPSEAHRIAEEHAQRYFEGNQCIIAVHVNTAHVHAHIIVNSVSYKNGDMLHISPQKYGRMKDGANELAEKYGFSTVDFRKPASVRETTAEKQIKLKGGISWKEELREVIDEAKLKTNNMSDFEKWLDKYGVKLGRNTEKKISYLHPEIKKAIRGERLGADYTKGAVLNVFDEQRNRVAAKDERISGGIDEKERGGVARCGDSNSSRRIGTVGGELRGIVAEVYSRTSEGRAEQKETVRRNDEEQQKRVQREARVAVEQAERIKREREQAKKRERTAEQEHVECNQELGR
jgi:hypothetical protein